MKFALLAAALIALGSPAFADQIQLEGDQSQWFIEIRLPIDMPNPTHTVPFTLDTGCAECWVTMDNGILFEMWRAGHAHQVATDPVVGIDGLMNAQPVYELDGFTIGDCHIPGPITAEGSSGANLIGENLLAQLHSVVQLDKGVWTFQCPTQRKRK